MEITDFGAYIKELRKKTGMNRRKFCEHFNIPYQTMTDWERNKRHAPDYVIRLLTYYILTQNPNAKEDNYMYKDKPELNFSDTDFSKDTNDENISTVAEATAGYNAVSSGSGAFDLKTNKNNTIDDYMALPDDVRVELIDGIFYDMAAPTSVHQITAGTVYTQLSNHIESKNGSCVPFISPIDVQLDRDDKNMVQPDIAVVCNPDKINKTRIYGAPDFIIEVLSQSNWYHDTVLKLRKYREAGVREYWIIMPENQKVLVYFFETSPFPKEYSFEDDIPVNIWGGECKINLKTVIDKLRLPGIRY